MVGKCGKTVKTGRPPIQDEFTNLPASRQRRWQIRNERDGLCVRCGKPAISDSLCQNHLDYGRRYREKDMNREKWNLGDTVEWASQSGGYYGKVKRGTVVQIVKAGETPDQGTMRVLGTGFGMSRNHESYLVRVGNIAYWPRVKHLHAI